MYLSFDRGFRSNGSRLNEVVPASSDQRFYTLTVASMEFGRQYSSTLNRGSTRVFTGRMETRSVEFLGLAVNRSASVPVYTRNAHSRTRIAECCVFTDYDHLFNELHCPRDFLNVSLFPRARGGVSDPTKR